LRSLAFPAIRVSSKRNLGKKTTGKNTTGKTNGHSIFLKRREIKKLLKKAPNIFCNGFLV